MNILFLSELFYPHGGGAEFATYLYAKSLASKGYDVVVVTNRFVGESEVSKLGGISLYRLPLFRTTSNVKYSMLRRPDILFCRSMVRLVKKADLVYVPRLWFLAIPWAKAYGKPTVLHLHDYIPVCPLAHLYDSFKEEKCTRKNSILCSQKCIKSYESSQPSRSRTEILTSVSLNSLIGPSLAKLTQLSDVAICVSEGQKELITTKAPFLAQKIHVIRNPLPELHYLDSENEGFAYFGGSSMMKGFHVLCKALEMSSDKRIQVIGTGFDLGKERYTSLGKARIEKHPWIGPKEMANIYGRIRAVIVPSICPEPLPYVVYEALLRGRIVIASDIGGIPEQVVGCPGTFLFPPGDSNELARLMTYVSSMDRQKARELGLQNRSNTLEKNQTEKSVQEFTTLVNSLV